MRYLVSAARRQAEGPGRRAGRTRGRSGRSESALLLGSRAARKCHGCRLRAGEGQFVEWREGPDAGRVSELLKTAPHLVARRWEVTEEGQERVHWCVADRTLRRKDGGSVPIWDSGMKAWTCGVHGPRVRERWQHDLEDAWEAATGGAATAMVTLTVPWMHDDEVFVEDGPKLAARRLGVRAAEGEAMVEYLRSTFPENLEGPCPGSRRRGRCTEHSRDCGLDGRCWCLHSLACRGRYYNAELSQVEWPLASWVWMTMLNPLEMASVLSYRWTRVRTRFMAKMRRSLKELGERAPAEYIRVLEFTGKGAPHLHILWEYSEVAKGLYEELVDGWLKLTPGALRKSQKLTLPGDAITRDGRNKAWTGADGVRYVTAEMAAGEVARLKHPDAEGWDKVRGLRRITTSRRVSKPTRIDASGAIAVSEWGEIVRHDERACRKARAALRYHESRGTLEGHERREEWEALVQEHGKRFKASDWEIGVPLDVHGIKHESVKEGLPPGRDGVVRTVSIHADGEWVGREEGKTVELDDLLAWEDWLAGG